MMVHYVKLLVVVYTGRNVYNYAPACKAGGVEGPARMVTGVSIKKASAPFPQTSPPRSVACHAKT